MPWTLVKRGFKKQVITPLDAPQEFLEEARRERLARELELDSALMRALGLAYHWQRLQDERRPGSVAEIAEAEGIDVTQVRRLMRLTLLAPEVVEHLAGAPGAVLERVMRRPWPNGAGTTRCECSCRPHDAPHPAPATASGRFLRLHRSQSAATGASKEKLRERNQENLRSMFVPCLSGSLPFSPMGKPRVARGPHLAGGVAGAMPVSPGVEASFW